MAKNKQSFTYEEVGSVLGISRTTIYKWQQQGVLPLGQYTIDVLEVAVDIVIGKKKQEISRIESRFNNYKKETIQGNNE